MPAGGIWLLNEDTGRLALTVHRGISRRFAQAASQVPLGVSITGMAAESGRTVVASDLLGDMRLPPKNKETADIERLKSMVSVPLSSKGKTLGVVNVFGRSRKDFPEEDILLLETIGGEVGVAIENARLLDKLSELSITDELTCLYNRRHFYEVLESEINRTWRDGGSFSLVLLDLDGFKEYNDRFGHTYGDEVLNTFARTVKGSLRKTDTAFRYGGDEFTVILPATGVERSKRIIDRLRSKWLKALEERYPNLETQIGFSAGIAQFPENATTVDGLVFLADSALYYAKREGGYRSTLVSDLSTLPDDVLAVATRDQVYALAATVDMRDPSALGHSARVAATAERMGRALGLSEKEMADLHTASMLHDIGKVGVPDAILTKPGWPTQEEWETIKRHCVEGARIVGYVKELVPLAPIIRHHHEWYDGRGYPDGLQGEEIPLFARIISVADVYDTMTTPRPYREVISEGEALEELRRYAGSQFDPQMVEALYSALAGEQGQD